MCIIPTPQQTTVGAFPPIDLPRRLGEQGTPRLLSVYEEGKWRRILVTAPAYSVVTSLRIFSPARVLLHGYRLLASPNGCCSMQGTTGNFPRSFLLPTLLTRTEEGKFLLSPSRQRTPPREGSAWLYIRDGCVAEGACPFPVGTCRLDDARRYGAI